MAERQAQSIFQQGGRPLSWLTDSKRSGRGSSQQEPVGLETVMGEDGELR